MTERMLKNRIEKLDAIAAQQKELEAALPDVYSQYTKQSSSRRFTTV